MLAPDPGRPRLSARGRRFDAAFSAGFPDKIRRAGGFLFPRETGALAQILVTTATTLVVAHGRPASLLLALASLALFFAHEPFLVVTGLRGPRARHENSAAAWRQLVVLPVVALGAGVGGLWLAPAGTAWALLAPGLPAVVLTPLVFGRLEKTVEGELLAALAIAGFCLPVARAGGVSWAHAAALAAVYATVLAVATLAVRRVTARAVAAMTRLKYVGPLVLGVVAEGALVVLAWQGLFPGLVAISPAPMLLFSFWLVLSPPHLRHIRKVGWTLAFCLTATSALLGLALA